MKMKWNISITLTLGFFLLHNQIQAQWLLTGNTGTNATTNFIGTTDYKPFKIRTNNLERLSVSQDGYVNVGMPPLSGTVGSSSFNINASISGWAGMYTNGTSSTTRAFYGYANQGIVQAYHYYDMASTSWRLYISGNDRLTVTQSGRVGIGTSNPLATLDVIGNGIFTGSVEASSLNTNTVSTTDLYTNTITTNGLSTLNGDLTVNGSAYFGDYMSAQTHQSNPAISGSAAISPSLVSYGVWGESHNASSYGVASSGNMKVIGNIECIGELFEISDAQFKTNVVGMKNTLTLIKQLKPCEYEYVQDSKFKDFKFFNKKDNGFIAQEIEKVFPSLVIEKTQPLNLKEPNGEKITYKMVNYVGLIPFLTNGIQEQQDMIETQNTEVENLKEQVNELKDQLKKLADLVSSQGRTNTEGSNNPIMENKLYVNSPNPFDKQTTIRYYISKNSNQASILIMDINGELINTYELTEKGEGSISISADQLRAGVYSYVLIVNNTVIDAKKMLISK